MSKKTISKAIAVICVMALCLTALFTGAVSAEARTATCTVTGYAYDVGAKDSYVTAEIKFESATAFTAGSFTVAGEGLTFNDCSVGQSTGGDAPEVYLNVSNKKILFAGFSESATNDIKSYTSLTLVVTFTVSDGQSVEKAAAGKSWAVNVSDIDITNTAEETYTTASASGSIHVHNFGSPSTANNVTTTTCSICGKTHAEVADTTGLTGNDLAATKKASVSFTATGDTVLNALVAKSVIDAGAYDNVYFIYQYKGDDAEPIKGTAVKSDTNTVNVGGTDYYVFPLYGDAGIGRISRNYSGNFVTVKGSTVTVSGLWEYSILAYAQTLSTEGNADEQNYAKALINYGYYTTEALGYDTAAYTGAPLSLADAALPASKSAVATGTDESWSIAGISVTTGFKPKMNIRFNAATLSSKDTVTIKVTANDKLVYWKEVAVSSLTGTGSDTYILSDIPTKYLNGDIVIGAKNGDTESAKTITYSYGKYAKARKDRSAADANVFQALVNWAYYLGIAFA